MQSYSSPRILGDCAAQSLVSGTVLCNREMASSNPAAGQRLRLSAEDSVD